MIVPIKYADRYALKSVLTELIRSLQQLVCFSLHYRNYTAMDARNTILILHVPKTPTTQSLLLGVTFFTPVFKVCTSFASMETPWSRPAHRDTYRDVMTHEDNA